jgi:hypothetical protein
MTTVEAAIFKASKKLNLPEELVGKVYKAYWKSIRQSIQPLPLKDDLTEEEFTKYKVSFNIPSLGKLYSSFNKIQGVKKRYQYLQKIKNNAQNKETKTDVH